MSCGQERKKSGQARTDWEGDLRTNAVYYVGVIGTDGNYVTMCTYRTCRTGIR